MTSTIFMIVFALLLLGYGSSRLLEVKICRHIPGEPPLVRARVPVVGHVLGLMRYGVSYYRMLREKTNHSIYTIFLASQKVYVVNSPSLISQISRRQKVIDSDAFFVNVVMGKLFGFGNDDLAELSRDPSEKGTLRRDSKVLEHSLLERGAVPLNEIFGVIMTGVADRLGAVAREGPPVTISLQAWLRELFTLATAEGLFGPQNPFARDPNLLDEFWQFESGVKGLTMGVFPSLTAAKPARARRRLVEAFVEFFENDSKSDGETCEFIRQLGDVAYRFNRDADYLARYFFAVFCAFIINTVPVIFWTIGHIVENRVLLARIRAELADVVGRMEGVGTGDSKFSVDVAAIRERCPLLVSTSNEVLRYVGASTSTLIVHEDVYIDDQYLLTKGALVQISATAVHSDPDIWGPNAANFDPERFLRPGKVHPSAFRTFGGGSTLCPGRHLASDEILVFTVMFLHSFAVGFTAEKPRLPLRDDTNMLSITKPRKDLKLRLSRYRGMERASWGIRKRDDEVSSRYAAV